MMAAFWSSGLIRFDPVASISGRILFRGKQSVNRIDAIALPAFMSGRVAGARSARFEPSPCFPGSR